MSTTLWFKNGTSTPVNTQTVASALIAAGLVYESVSLLSNPDPTVATLQVVIPDSTSSAAVVALLTSPPFSYTQGSSPLPPTPPAPATRAYGYLKLYGSTTLALTDPALICCDSTAGPFTVTLPPVSTGVGWWAVIKDEAGQAGVNNITIARSGSATIEGDTTFLLDVPFEQAQFFTNGVNWFVLSY